MKYIFCIRKLLVICVLLLVNGVAFAQFNKTNGIREISNKAVRLLVNENGSVNYYFANGSSFENSFAYIEDVKMGNLKSIDFKTHTISVEKISDTIGGKGRLISIIHDDSNFPFRFIQNIVLYDKQPHVLISAKAESKNVNSFLPGTRNISPFALIPSSKGLLKMPGTKHCLIDFPFDNDNWVDVVTRNLQEKEKMNGVSYELAAMYDKETFAGFVAGSVTHDVWKTGIIYSSSKNEATLDSLVIYGGAATPDIPGLPDSFGGKDGTHDVMPHGIVRGPIVQSPVIFLLALDDVRNCYMQYGKCNSKVNGSKRWKADAPVYWNSFGVEDVLGHRNVMMPPGVNKISDFIQTLDNFNACQPVLSIDSYDQNIYSTKVLASIEKYAAQKGQKLGFYFTPFALWTWSNAAGNTKMTGSDYTIGEVILKDASGNFVPYKKGDWGAYPLDPTHPATRLSIIDRLLKAKAIGATFIKIDFLTAGALEAAGYFNKEITTGMQAYNYGMKMLQHLTDSIMGPDVFITMAISPMFPHQYAHTRFLSTDVYSHLRNDQTGFPHWGSTASSMISATNLWWVQGTLWPYTNMDVMIMKSFQKNPDLNEQEIKVRLYTLITMGSILGDGSDYRNELTAQRARIFLNNKNACLYFKNPRAFTPINFPEGVKQDQQLSFYLPGDTVLLSAFNFDKEKPYNVIYKLEEIGLKKGRYLIKDFLTDREVGSIDQSQSTISLSVPVKDALLLKIEKRKS